MTGVGDFEAMQVRVRGTNINEQTLLATDYLNHFNEIVMMLDMVPDMPECLDDIKEWQPKTYQEHFRDSTFSDRDLAVEAYDFVPERFKIPFEATLDKINRLIDLSIRRADEALAEGDPEKLRVMIGESSRIIQRLQDQASAIIHGSATVLDQDGIDDLLEL